MAATTSLAAKALADRLRKDLGITGPRSKANPVLNVREVICIRFDCGDSPYPEIITAIRGIAWCRTTGRVDYWVEQILCDLSDWGWCNLLADVAVACRVEGEVPYYLARRFPEPAQV